MDILNQEYVKGFIRLMTDGSNRGWHERNGGNLSYRLTLNEAEIIKANTTPDSNWFSIGTTVPELCEEMFLITGTGKFFKNAAEYPEETIGIIEIDSKGENYRILWGFLNGGRPTSELPTHLMNHEVKKKWTNNRHRVIYHAHTTNIISLTFILPQTDEVFTRQLWDMMPECPVVFPEGLGVIEWMVPGGEEIGMKTSKMMEEYNIVIWSNHGTFCSEETFDFTFGLMDTVEKAAEMLIKVLSINPNKQPVMTSDQLRALGSKYNVSINPKFLK